MSFITLTIIQKNSSKEDTNEQEQIININLPAIIGRGSMLKCPEKKLSRNHGKIDWEEDGILIESTHPNPTFVCIGNENKTLHQNQSAVLKHGDKFGLLEEVYWFKVGIPHQIKTEPDTSTKASLTKTTENVTIKSEVPDVKPKVEPKMEEECGEDKIFKSIKDEPTEHNLALKHDPDNQDQERPKVIQSKHIKTESPTSAVESYSPVKKERNLPNWMHSSNNSSDKQLNHGEGTKLQKPITPSNVDSPKRKRKASEQTIVSPKKESESCKKKKQYHELSEELGETMLAGEEEHGLPGPSRTTEKSPQKIQIIHELSDDESEDETPKKGATASTENDQPASEDPKVSSSKSDKRRTSCSYGGKCYRQNPLHKQDEAHPGDSDYLSDASENDKAECEYGTGCYRTSTSHRKQFKHTRKTQPRRRATNVNSTRNEDSDDSEDPFMYDGSSDDYAPTESGSDTDFNPDESQDDNKRLLQEAKKFVRQKH